MPPHPGMQPPPRSLPGRGATIAGLIGAIALAWAWIVPAALDMYGDMDGLAAWMMLPRWSLRYAALVLAMWITMMAGMMLPSAIPAVLSYRQILCRQARPRAPRVRVGAFAAGYLLTWAGFSVAATLAQWALTRAALLTPMMASASTRLSGVLLLAAGLYQWSPWKRSCLKACRSPLDFLGRHWRPGVAGALRIGVAHGIYCLGCCWLLMLLLFVGGVMSLACIIALALVVFAEKLAPERLRLGQWAGAALVGLGLWMLW